VVDIRPVADDGEAHAAATIMAASEPWITLGRTFDRCLSTLHDDTLERYVAVDGGEVLGFVLLSMRGTFTGYIKSLGVREDCRSRGLGARLMAFAEDRIFRDTPNVFICVSSFNPRAKAFYERLGYEVVGPLRDFIVRGYDEILLRKTTGPVTGFSRG
jgi:ribosomal-protein-alanine N-acetyltransferase